MIELLVYYRFLPEISLAILHPFKVRGGHAACVAENIWDYEYAFIRQNIVSSGRGWPVRAFGQNLAFDPVRVAASNLILGGCRNEDFAIGDQQIGRIGGIGAGEAMGAADLLVIDCAILIPAATENQSP